MDLDELYQEIILDHFRHPRHAGALAEGEELIDEENPTCGDQIRLTAEVRDGKVHAVRYEANGCAISVASASMMADHLVGKTVKEARSWVRDFVDMMKGQKEIPEEDLGDIAALAGVKRYPMRIKCATMSWHALDHALDKLGA